MRIQCVAHQPNILANRKFSSQTPQIRASQAQIKTTAQEKLKELSKNTYGIASPTLIAITAIASFVLLCASLIKRSKKSTETPKGPSVVTPAPKPIIKEPIKLEYTKENLDMLTKEFEKLVSYEKEIDFANLEILQKLSPEEKNRIVDYLKRHPKDAENFIAFATGEVSGTLQCVDTPCVNIFSSLEDVNTNINSVNLFWDKGGDLVLNKKATKEIIRKNLDFFKIRLNLPAEASVEDVEKELFSFSYNSPLRNNKKSGDLMEILIGNDIYDACHAQIVRDIKNSGKRFYPGCADTLEEYKTILKDSLSSNQSSYYNMPQKFKDDLIKKINSIPLEAFKERIDEPIEFIRETRSELEEFRRLERIVKKLETAQKLSSTVKFE